VAEVEVESSPSQKESVEIASGEEIIMASQSRQNEAENTQSTSAERELVSAENESVPSLTDGNKSDKTNPNESDEEEAEAVSVFHGRLEMVPDGDKITVVDRSSSDTVNDANLILREIQALDEPEASKIFLTEVKHDAVATEQSLEYRPAPEISIELPSPEHGQTSPKAGSEPEPESPEISIRLDQGSPDGFQSPDDSVASPERLVIVVDSTEHAAGASDLPSLITVNATSGTTSIAITTAPIVTAASTVSTYVSSSPDVVVASHAKFVSTIAIVENVDKKSPADNQEAAETAAKKTPVASPRPKKDEERKTPISTPKISKKTPVSSPKTTKKVSSEAESRSPPTSPTASRRHREDKPEREQQGVLQYLCNPCLACFKRKK
jgi:hypothetical protein